MYIYLFQDGLLHISKIPQCAIEKQNIHDVMQVGDLLQVVVDSVAPSRDRIGLVLQGISNNNNNIYIYI